MRVGVGEDTCPLEAALSLEAVEVLAGAIGTVADTIGL